MAGQLRDRFFEYAPDRWVDLLTGEAHDVPPEAAPRRRAPPPEALIELLEHGRAGSPRSIAIAENGLGSRAQASAAADAAVRCGYVPVSVRVYLGARHLLSEELRDRTLMLIALPGSRAETIHSALLRAAATSPRPHVLVTFHRTDGARHDLARALTHERSQTDRKSTRLNSSHRQ